jgi:Spy/CpxP family protein refolding chaperone
MLLLTVSVARAQGPAMIPWWEGTIKNDIGLSDDQSRQVRDILHEERPRLVQLRHAVEAAEADLKQEMDASQVDIRKANDAIEKVVAARADMMRAVSQMSLRLRLTLTPAQWQELQKRQLRPGGPRRMRPPAGGMPAASPPGPANTPGSRE